ncbi:DUF2958 domain-containing protein [Sphingomonas oryzagri]
MSAPWMMRQDSYRRLLSNHVQNYRLRGTKGEIDFIPVVKLFNATGVGTWLLTECDQDGLAFGLCDVGYPEMGYVSMDELAELKGLGGLGVEEDIHFRTDKRLSVHATEARRHGYIKA